MSKRIFLTITTAVLATAFMARAAEVELFNGKDFDGWKSPIGEWYAVGGVKLSSPDPKVFSAKAGQGVMVNDKKGKSPNLVTASDFGDCELHVEFNIPKESNSGVFLMGRYEVQISDSASKKALECGDCGGIYKTCKDAQPEFAGAAPRRNASKAPGVWQSFDVVFRAPRFDAAGKKTENAKFIKVTHNGTVIHENVEVPRATCAANFQDEAARGPLVLQGGKGPVAFRDLKIKPVELK
jgi:hypothetical protein